MALSSRRRRRLQGPLANPLTAFSAPPPVAPPKGSGGPRILMPNVGSGGSTGTRPHNGGGGGSAPPTHTDVTSGTGYGRPGGGGVVTGGHTYTNPGSVPSGYPVPSTVPASHARTPSATPALVPLKPPNSPRAAPNLAPLLNLLPNSFQPYAPDVLAAAAKYNVQPSVLFGLLKVESGFGTAANTFTGSGVGPGGGAKGVSQFEDATAASTTGPGIPKGGVITTKDTPRAIKSQIFGAANLLNSYGVQKDTAGALAAYNAGPAAPPSAAGTYPQDVLSAAKPFAVADKLAQAGAASSFAKVNVQGKGPYVYPFPKQYQSAVVPGGGRTDQGVDPVYTGPVRAIGKARVIAAPGGQAGSGWPDEQGQTSTGGTGSVYKLLQGPLAGKKIYTYEGVKQNVNVGDILHKGEVYAQSGGPQGNDFEMGYARGAKGGFEPVATRADQPPIPASHDNTQAGLAFHGLLSALAGGGRYPTNLHNPSGASAATGGATATGGGFGTSTGSDILGLSPGSPAAAVASTTGANPIAAQTAVTQAKQQNRPQDPSLVPLTPPAGPASVPFPAALAALFGGQLPSMGGGVSSGPASGMSTTDLATLLASLSQSQTQNPLQALTTPPRRRRRG